MFLDGNSKLTPPEYINYVLCREFGWTFQELMSQPSSFIDEILLVMNIETKIKNKTMKNGR